MSTKFVPLITNLLGMADSSSQEWESRIVGDPIQMPDEKIGWTMIAPDGTSVKVDPKSNDPMYFEMPGVYLIQRAGECCEPFFRVAEEVKICEHLGLRRRAAALCIFLQNPLNQLAVLFHLRAYREGDELG